MLSLPLLLQDDLSSFIQGIRFNKKTAGIHALHHMAVKGRKYKKRTDLLF
jgi:hypothetical protein